MLRVSAAYVERMRKGERVEGTDAAVEARRP